MPKISKTRFVIAVPNLRKSAAFYRDVLGFTIETIADPGWLFYQCGSCVIMAGESPDAIDPAKLGDHCYYAYLQIDDIDRFYESCEPPAPKSARRFAMNRGGCASLAWSQQMGIGLCTGRRSGRNLARPGSKVLH